MLHAPWLTGGLLVATILATVPWITAIGMQIGMRNEDAIRRTVIDELLGWGGTAASLSQVITHEPQEPRTISRVLIYLALWIFLAGGIVDRLARGRALGAAAFFGICGFHLGRFVRLGILAGALYWLEITAYERWPASTGVDAVFLVVTIIINLIAMFAAIRVVVEDRRSVLDAFAASVRFIRRRPARILALYGLTTAAQILLSHPWLWTADLLPASVLVAAVFMVLSIWARLASLAVMTAFFQGELAHAHYTAGPTRLWPDSPAVEAIENLTRTGRVSNARTCANDPT